MPEPIDLSEFVKRAYPDPDDKPAGRIHVEALRPELEELLRLRAENERLTAENGEAWQQVENLKNEITRIAMSWKVGK
ncbi:MAG TPA: hypothetical protein VMZ51_08050 [Acidimicrobiales bacterium]|nr:hypothetical protein [Acidimicrobiales bacterium]